MSTSVDTPPIDQLATEVVATLCLAGLAYLAKDDLESAATACDLAGSAYERISSSMRPAERTSLGELVTELRLAIVQKRGA